MAEHRKKDTESCIQKEIFLQFYLNAIKLKINYSNYGYVYSYTIHNFSVMSKLITITQNKGKESENSYQKLKRSL